MMSRLEVRQIEGGFEVNMSNGGDIYFALLDDNGFRDMLNSCNKLLTLPDKKHNSFYS